MKIKKTNRLVLCLGIALTVLIAGFWGYRVCRINTLIPQAKLRQYNSKEWVDWKNGVQIRTDSSYFMDNDEIESNKNVEDSMLLYCDSRLLWLTVSLRNEGDESADVQMLEIGAESVGWANIAEMSFYYAIGNSDRDLKFELKPGEEVTLELPFHFAQARFTKSEWENLEKKDYYLTLKLYPEKRMIAIPQPL